MKSMKKLFSLVCSIMLSFCFCVTNVYAEEDIVNPQITSMENLNFEFTQETDLPTIDPISSMDPDSITIADFEPPSLLSKANWKIEDPILIYDSTLTDAYDIYLVTLTTEQIVTLKLRSSNPNLLAILYNVDNGYLGDSTGFGVHANQSHAIGLSKAQQYAILVGSASGTETGDYTLMWNASNPSGGKKVIDVSPNLERVILYYDDQTVLCNGDNFLKNLTWEDSQTWPSTYGYSARSMSITLIPDDKKDAVKALYLSSNFKTTAPYSASKVLLVDVNCGSWCYLNSFYENIGGSVKHFMDYTDLSGLKTPRTFGEGADDYGEENFIVIDLDKFQVCDFISRFNFYYNTEVGNRSFSMDKPIMIN